MKQAKTKKTAKTPMPTNLVTAMFNEAGVELRPGRAKAISGALFVPLTNFRSVAARLPLEAEPGLFPARKGAKK
jgi:hypothetical protein